MISVSFYKLENGHFTGDYYCGPEGTVEQNTPPGCGYVQGRYDKQWRRDQQSGELVHDATIGKPEDTPLIVWQLQDGRWRPQHTFAGRKLAMAERVLESIRTIEGSADRAVRELVLATGSAPAAARMQAIEEAIAPLRARLAAINAAGSHEELDALGD